MYWSSVWAYIRNIPGGKIKRASWEGYWTFENGTIMMHCKKGEAIDIHDTDDTKFTFDNIAANDWIIINDSEKEDDDESYYAWAASKMANDGWDYSDAFFILRKASAIPWMYNKLTYRNEMLANALLGFSDL